MNIEKKSLWIFLSPLFSRRAQSIALVLAMLCAPSANAQEKSEPLPAGAHTQHPSPHPATADEEDRFPEVEFVASNKFRSFSYLQPVYRGLNFEGHYFDVEDNDVGAINGSWTFRLREGIKLSPGFGLSFGQNVTTAPALTFRWDVEQGPIVSQGLFIQGLRKSSEEEGEEEVRVYPNIWDGNHVSYRYDRLQIGPSWEHIHAREGDEWKVGGRAAYRILKNVTAVMFVMAPDTEIRFGVMIHPPRE